MTERYTHEFYTGERQVTCERKHMIACLSHQLSLAKRVFGVDHAEAWTSIGPLERKKYVPIHDSRSSIMTDNGKESLDFQLQNCEVTITLWEFSIG